MNRSRNGLNSRISGASSKSNLRNDIRSRKGSDVRSAGLKKSDSRSVKNFDVKSEVSKAENNKATPSTHEKKKAKKER